MKRFWREVQLTGNGPWGVALDGKPVRTPARALLALPGAGLAAAVAAEWDAVADRIDPAAMPLTGLANAATDLIAADPAGHAGRLAAYAASDLLCYRAEGPEALVARQAAAFEPVLGWAEAELGISMVVTAGLMPVAQAQASLDAVHARLLAHGPFALAALAQLVPISGSALLALALAAGALDVDAAWTAATLDEAWSAENWGEDADAAAALAAREAAFRAAHRFLELVQTDDRADASR